MFLSVAVAGSAVAQQQVVCDPPYNPTADIRVLCQEDASSEENIAIDIDGLDIDTNGIEHHGIAGFHLGTGGIDIDVTDVDIDTDGRNSRGIYGKHQGTGSLAINVEGGSIITDGHLSINIRDNHGIEGSHEGMGNIRIDATNVDIDTVAVNSFGIYGEHSGTGSLTIDVKSGSITTKRSNGHGIVGIHEGAGNLRINAAGVDIDTGLNSFGSNAYGIRGRHTGSQGNLIIDVRGGSIDTKQEAGHAVYAFIAPKGNNSGDGDLRVSVRGGSFRTEGRGSYGFYLLHKGASGNVVVDIQNADIDTADLSGVGGYGIYAKNQISRAGSIVIGVAGSSIDTKGGWAAGISGVNSADAGTGKIDIDLFNGSSVTTKGYAAFGILANQSGNSVKGDIDVSVFNNSSVTTEGSYAYGIFGIQSGDSSSGNIMISLDSSSIATVGEQAQGIHARHVSGDGLITVALNRANVIAEGPNASGVKIGRFNSTTMLMEHISTKLYSLEGLSLRRQTVTVDGDSSIRGGSEDAAGVYLVGGGRVVVRGASSLAAKSGTAIRSARKLDTDPPPNLRVDLYPGGRPIPHLLKGRIVNDGGRTFVTVHDQELYDSDAWPYTSPRWISYGTKDVALASDFVEMEFGRAESYITRYGPRTAVYEVLPGFMLRLDGMGVSGKRPYESNLSGGTRLSGVRGSFRPSASNVGARYSFDGQEAAAGVDIPLTDGLTAGLNLRWVSGGADVSAPGVEGGIRTKGRGLSGEVTWQNGEDIHAAAHVSATNYDLDLSSSLRGTLARDVEASVLAWGAEVGRQLTLANKTVAVRAWLDRSEVSMEGLTDPVGTSFSLADGARTAAGMGIAGRTALTPGGGGLSLNWSMGAERELTDGTAVLVSGERLVSRGPKTRLLLGLLAEYRVNDTTLTAGLSADGHGSGDRSLSAEFQFGTRF